MRSSLPYVCLITSLAAPLAACGGDDGGAPLSTATSLVCPTPGASLPFRLPSQGFQSTANATTAKSETQNKDEASDTIGNPGGAVADVFLDDNITSSPQPIYQGVKARAKTNTGLISDVLGGENVSLWFYDTGAKMWTSVATTKTDADGGYALATTGLSAPAGEPVYAMLDADGSCAVHYDYLYPAGTQVVVVDIDGTLTTDNGQIITQLSNETYVPKMPTAANTLTTEWVKKGYPVIYLTARPHAYRAESRSWLTSQGFARGALITENGGEAADAYKAIWLKRMTQTFGWQIAAAYGNEQTDLNAYGAVNVPVDKLFVIGPLGDNATTPPSTPIANLDYTAHITSYVDAQPDISPLPPGTGSDAAALR
jgi:hypothetical protein